MQTLGQRLREERVKRGLSIEELAEQTRINPQYFKAIEEDNREALPGGFFYRSFLRQYARLLELPDSVYNDEITHSLEVEQSVAAKQMESLKQRHIDVPPLPAQGVDRAGETRRWVIRLGVLVIVVGLSTGMYQLWLQWRTQDANPQSSTAPLAPPVQMPESKQPAAPPVSQPEPAPAAPTGTPQDATQSAPPQAAEPAPVTAPEGAVRLVLTATDTVWLDVIVDGKREFMGMLQAGESRSFGGATAIRLRTGNAGGVQIGWNGKALEPVGPKGQVRTVVFSPGGFEIIQPQPAGPPTAPAKPEGQ